MDWDRFTFDYEIDANGMLPNVVHIEAYKEAAMNLVLPPDWRQQLDRLNRVRAVHGTTALEGNPLSEAEVARQIDMAEMVGPRSPDGATKEQLQIRNAGLAQGWVKERFYPGCAPLTVTDLLAMHEMITQHSDTINNVPGRFRDFSVTVGSEATGGVHRGAPHENIPALMDGYIEFLRSRKLAAAHPVIRALLAHFFLVTIHPFGDGNGRVSRLVEAGILFQGGYNVHGFYGLSNYFYRNEAEYKTSLQQSRSQQPFEVTAFVNFGLVGFAKELKGINNFIKTKLNRVVYRATLVRAFNTHMSSRRRLLNQREHNLLHFLLTHTEPEDPFSDSPSRQITYSELLASPYITEAYKHVTSRTFVRELFRLRDMGFIHFTTQGPARGWTIEIDFDAIGRY
ncbi:MAG TPA: Fic family protein [Blastocatellia bacterium]|nr:Fic family protein [Blastocatellia bacterium]